jgi:hypothetical protein
MKAVIRHFPLNTALEDMSDRLVSLCFDVTSVKQMTATRQSPPEESTTIRIPLLYVCMYGVGHKPGPALRPSMIYHPPVPHNLAEDGKIPRNFQTIKPLPHRSLGRGL